MLPDPRDEPTVGVERGGRLLGFSRPKAYMEASRYEATGGAEGLPVIRFGRSLRVPTAALYRLVGLPLPGDDHVAAPEHDDTPTVEVRRPAAEATGTPTTQSLTAPHRKERWGRGRE